MDLIHLAFATTCLETHTEGATGRCCRCGQHAPVTPLKAVFSAKFTAWDLVGPGDGLCPPCRWAYQPSHRTEIWWLTPITATLLTRSQLADRLSQGPLKAATTLPLSGRKHLLPYARLSTIRTEDTNLAWTSRDATRLCSYLWLRVRGCSRITDPAPSWAWLKTQPHQVWSAIREHWGQLEPWRRCGLYLRVAAAVSRKEKL